MVQREIVQTWAEQYDDELFLALPRGPHDIAEIKDLGITPAVTRAVLHPQLNAVEVPKLVRRLKADASFTHNFGAAGSNVAFVHDLIFVDHPEWFTRVERAYFALMRLSLRTSEIVTSSQVEADRIMRIMRPSATVTPVGLAISPSLAHADPEPVAGVPGRFMLCVGRLTTRKNLEVVLQAIRGTQKIHVGSLVVVGQPDSKTIKLREIAADLLDEGRLIVLQECSMGELAWLYQNCRAFISMSRDEGFGLPIAEARYFGCRSILSDTAVSREVGDSASLYVGTDDVRALVSAMQHIGDVPRGKRSVNEWSSIVEQVRYTVLNSFAGAARKNGE